MKLRSLLGAALILFSFIAVSQEFSIIDQHYFSDEYSIPNYVEFDKNQQPSVDDLDQFLSPYWKGKEAFDLRLKDRFEDQYGGVHLKYVQTYQGFDIELAEWILHLNGDKIVSMNGKLVSEYPLSAEMSLSESEALKSATDAIGAEVYKWELPEEEQFLKWHENDPNATFFPKAEFSYMSKNIDLNTSELRLCYKFNIYAHEPMSRQEVYIDAQNGEMIFSNSLINNTNTPSTAVTGYSGTRSITTDSTALNSFRLRQTASGNGVNTYDLNNSTVYANAVDFTNNSKNWNIANAQLDQYALDAHWATEQTYNYLLTKFNRNSINNAGFALNTYVHYSSNYVNAFWNGQWMTYGDGNGSTITPLTSLDIVGHEIGHGMTAFTANLIYNRESGAINESYSDILGTSVEFYARPNRANWTMGEDIGITIRNMANPNQYRDPDTYGGTYWVNQVGCIPTQQNNLCGIHTNMGVHNFWFYLVSAGGSGTNDNADTYSVTGIGIDKAAAIAYRSLTVYLIGSSDFREARFYHIKSAIDLYGACSAEVEAVTRAWYAVGVGPNYINAVVSDFASADTTACQAPFTVSFSDNSSNAVSYLWDFGDSTTSTDRNPTHTYTRSGQFDVTLFVNGGTCGNDTLVRSSYVDIDTSNACVVILANGNNPTQTDCSGKIYDSGGAGGTYGNNELSTLTIAPAGASSVTLNFLSFDVEAGTGPGLCDYDFLEIFDGSSITGTSLGKFCNNVQPPTSITSTRGSITLRFRSDGGLVQNGFEIDWSCNFPSSAPSANFSWSADTSCTGEIGFTDNSTQAPTSWFWDFGDGNSSTHRDPIHQYLTNGTYSVQLITTNTFGADTTTKSNIIYIDRPNGPTVTNDTVCVGQPAVLSATGTGRLDWYTNEIGGTQVNTGASLNLTNLLNDTTFWVEDYVRPATQNGGALNNNFGTGANFNGDHYLVFDVFKTLILTDVFVYAQGNGIRTIELRDNNGVVLQSKTLNISNGLANVDLDFRIEPGTDYQLGVNYLGGNTLNLYRNNSGASYPYNIPGMLSIKRSSANSNPLGFYYFFYFWRVKEPDCISARVPVSAVKDPNCGITSINEQSIEDQIQLYPNPAKDQVELIIPAYDGNLQISLWSLDGKKVKDIHETNGVSSALQKTVDLSDLQNGVYLTRIIANDKSKTIRLVVF